MSPRIRGRFQNRGSRRRAVVALQVGVFLTVLLGMAALTIDVGALYNARADLQRASDAAALAGASAYVTDTMMRVRTGSGGSDTLATVVSMAQSRVVEYTAKNPTLGLSTTSVSAEDIAAGWLNVNSATEALNSNPVPKDYNAVKVTLRRESSELQGANGAVKLYFAPVLGWLVGETQATATAVFDDRVASVQVVEEAADMMPFTIHRDAFEQELAEGGDNYAYNESSGAISSSSDGIREVRIYPYPLSGSGYTEGDGNFGVLNIGTGNQGIAAEEQQIINGVPASDFELEIGTSDLTFYDDGGAPVTYDITGSPGMAASLKTVLATKIGQVVGFFLHDNVILSGSNAIYTITDIRYGRVMDVRLTGNPNERGVFIQPVSYTGGNVRIDPQAPSTGGLVGRLVLAR